MQYAVLELRNEVITVLHGGEHPFYPQQRYSGSNSPDIGCKKSSAEVHYILRQPSDLPQVHENLSHMNILVEQKHHSYSSAFLHQQTNFLQEVSKKGLKQSVYDALVMHLQNVSRDRVWLQTTLNWTSWFLEKISDHLHIQVAPKMTSLDIMSRFCRTHNWSLSAVKALAWHPNVAKLAVGYSDHSVRLYSKMSTTSPLLKHKVQRYITCLAWQAYASSVLAVGCQQCILIWHVDPHMLSARPSGSAVQILERHGHSPITSLAWSPDGLLLVSSSASDASIIVWDVAQEQAEKLQRKAGYGNPRVVWSPSGTRLMCTTQTNIVRLWNTSTWECEKWNNRSNGRWTSSCWSADGSLLLFTGESEPVIFALCFDIGRERQICDVAKQVAVLKDCLPADVCEKLEDFRIKDMAWDHTNSLLALLVAGQNQVARLLLFRTRLGLTLELTYRGILLGTTDNHITAMDFCCSTPHQTTLTTAWLNGEVIHLPLTDLDCLDVKRERPSSSPFSMELYS